MTDRRKQLKDLLLVDKEVGRVVLAQLKASGHGDILSDRNGDIYWPLFERCCLMIKDFKDQDNEALALLNFIFTLLPHVQEHVSDVKRDVKRDVNSDVKSDDRNEGDRETTVYSHVIPLLSSVIFKLNPMSFSGVEETLLKNVLEDDMTRVQVAMDLWTTISRANEDSRQTHLDFIAKTRLLLPKDSFKREVLGVLIERLLLHSHEDDVKYFLRRFDPVLNGLWFGIELMEQQERRSRLKIVMENVFSGEQCLLQDIQAASHLMNSLSDFDVKEEAAKLSSLIRVILEKETLEKQEESVLKECLSMISRQKQENGVNCNGKLQTQDNRDSVVKDNHDLVVEGEHDSIVEEM